MRIKIIILNITHTCIIISLTCKLPTNLGNMAEDNNKQNFVFWEILSHCWQLFFNHLMFSFIFLALVYKHLQLLSYLHHNSNHCIAVSTFLHKMGPFLQIVQTFHLIQLYLVWKKFSYTTNSLLSYISIFCFLHLFTIWW